MPCHCSTAAAAAAVVCRRKVPRGATAADGSSPAGPGRGGEGVERALPGFASSPGLACETVSTSEHSAAHRKQQRPKTTPTRPRENDRNSRYDVCEKYFLGDLCRVIFTNIAPLLPRAESLAGCAPAARCPYLAAVRLAHRNGQPSQPPSLPRPPAAWRPTYFVTTNSRPGPARPTPPLLFGCLSPKGARLARGGQGRGGSQFREGGAAAGLVGP